MVTKKINKDLLIGIDIGGTKVKLVLMRGSKVLAEDKYLLKSFKTSRQFLATLIAHLELLIKPYTISRIRGIGIGLPGILNKERTKVLMLPNSTIIKNINFKKILQDKFRLPVLLENDTNAMALGEMMYGAGKGMQSLVMLSLGTGVGAGIIFRHGAKLNLLTGHHGAAGEIGHMIINFNGIEGRPKKKGTLEQYASAKFLKRRNVNQPLKIQQEAKAGKKSALKIYQELGHYLGYGLANIVNIFDPEVIVLSGGVSEAYDLFIKPAKLVMKNNLISSQSADIKILKSKLGDRAGAIGAAALWLR
ncbi:MAG: hypothetical protein AUJ28_03680 [Parcubacteria group bacterium CG1_02_37_51]|uniref:ROK family protein n=2 Tax=Candidatus Komeiliibacteriota TaxID=1817908 RepID=A0A2M8DRS7_9BACT|nr:MAG: hypothetical protein AUJ28_03680 [Parcubacteria group bacterium CG1_02_37_51]PIY95242.1 MAG: hypothetical protein COY67_00970 [Candidatus Komeilibacteria bacterium CG_4_10_14_0_8_um_filter_37_78]PJC02048.1 MAG: hypothetical protein CO073_01535 [Candidatus Komeilibacteria bacterium CG_4_9_14_0_8_um_filter_36_9]